MRRVSASFRSMARLTTDFWVAAYRARLDAAGIPAEQTWAELTKIQRGALVAQLHRSEFEVAGKNLNKDEFVTCGGVRLKEIDPKTMESRRCPGVYFAGEVTDVDGITGGFNFQNAWTGGHLAGLAAARAGQG